MTEELFADLPDVIAEPVEESTSIVPAKPASVQADYGRAAQLEHIKHLEDELLAKSLEVVGDVVNFADIAEDEQEIPEALVQAHGKLEAEKKFRRMKAAWRSTKHAPAALGIAGAFATKVINARATERAEPRPLLIVMMPAPSTAPVPYEVRNVDDD